MTADVDVKPEVQLGQYKGIEVKVEYTVSDHDKTSTGAYPGRQCPLVNIEDRSIQNGDLVTLDYAGTIDEAFDGGTAENRLWRLVPAALYPASKSSLQV